MAERTVHLDPSKLLGFRIAVATEEATSDARLGGKVGEEPKQKDSSPPSRMGTKVGGKLGVFKGS